MTGRRVFAAMVGGTASILLALLLLTIVGKGALGTGVASRILEHALPASGAINVVATVLLDFRAFDTLGEASVIFAVVATVGALFAGSALQTSHAGSGLLVRRAVAYLSALFLVFPTYIVLNGHLSPGGGFQGGVSLAVLIILLTVVFGTAPVANAVPVGRLHRLESWSALAFILVGLMGIFQGAGFLANAAAGFPRGIPGSLLSGGAIPILNMVIGLKVAAGLGSIFFDLMSTIEE